MTGTDVVAAPGDEVSRLELLRALGILDTPPEPAFDEITRVVANVLEVPIALVGFVDADRVWLKSAVGLDVTEVPRRGAFASRVPGDPGELLVLEGEQAAEVLGPSVPGVLFCALSPLCTRDGKPVGVLAALDTRPRPLVPELRRLLPACARQLSAHLEERREHLPRGASGPQSVDGSRYRELVEASNGSVCVHDLRGTVLSVSPAGARLLGYTPAEIVGRSLADFVPPHFRAHLDGYLSRVGGTGSDGGALHLVSRLGESRVWAYSSERRGDVVLGNAVDITQQKHVERELAKRVRLATLEAAVGAALTGPRRLREMLQGCAEAMAAFLQGAATSIWTLAPGEDELELQGTAGLGDEGPSRRSRVRVGEFFVGTVATRLEPLVLSLAEESLSGGLADWASRAGMAFYAGFPMLVEQRVAGVISVFSTRPPDRTTLDAMTSMAQRIALALENARLLGDQEAARARIQQHASELEVLNEIGRIATEELELRPMLQRILDAMRRQFGCEFVACGVFDEQRGLTVCEALSTDQPAEIGIGSSVPAGRGIVGQVALTGEPLLIDDVTEHPGFIPTIPGILSEVCVPIRSRGQLVGLLDLESTTRAAFRGQLTLIQTAADQVAGAIAGARLLEDVRRRASHLEIISEVSRTALAATDLDAVLTSIVQFVQRRFRLTVVYILLQDRSRADFELVALATEGPVEISHGVRLRRRGGLAESAFATGEPQLRLGARSEPAWVPGEHAIAAALAVPIRFEREVLGTLNLQSTDAGAFSKENVQVLRTIADQVAGAIRMASVNRSLAEANTKLRDSQAKLAEAQERISRLLASSPSAHEEIASWVDSLADEVARWIGARDVGLWELEAGRLVRLTRKETGERSSESAVPPGESLVESEGRVTARVEGISGELCGVLVASGLTRAVGEPERRLLEGLARQLGGALEVARMRKQLAAGRARRAATGRVASAGLAVCPQCGRCFDEGRDLCPEDGTQLDASRGLPSVLLERYRLLRQLGEGGMGTVFLASDRKLEREVAIKLLRAEHFGNSLVRSRFEMEARAIARIRHPNVIALHDSGELEDGSAFLVMEMLSGHDLGRLLAEHGRGTPAQVAVLLRQGGAGLAAAHRAELVHRDIKPENLFLTPHETGFGVTVLDFGLAKPFALGAGPTQHGTIVGTPAYMSPEQAQGGVVDVRSDLYSFAAVTYEALVGRRAISGSDVSRILANVLDEVPAPPSSLVPELPPEVDQAFRAALDKERNARPADVEGWIAGFVHHLPRCRSDAPGWPFRGTAPGRTEERGDG